jgi:hypothetical protein
MANEVTLFQPPQPQISFTGEQPTQLNQDTVDTLTEKYDYALGDTSPGRDYLVQSFWLGHERRIRDMAAIQEAMAQRQERSKQVLGVTNLAASEGRSLTSEERRFVYDTMNAPVDADPNTVLERMFAARFIDEAAPAEKLAAMEEDPQATEMVDAHGKDFVAKQQAAMRVAEDIQARLQQNNWLNTGTDFLKGLVPFWTWANVHSKFEGVKSDGFLTGDNITQQARGAYLLPLDQFQRELQSTVDEIAKTNILDAVYYANAMVSYSSSDELWDNVFTGLDALDVATLGAGAAIGVAGKVLSGGSAVTKYANRVKAATRGMANPKASKSTQLVLQGDIPEAARERVKTAFANVGASVSDSTGSSTSQMRGNIEALASRHGMLNPKNYVDDPGTLSNEMAARLQDDLAANKDLIISTMVDLQVVPHIIEEAAILKGMENAESNFRRTFRYLEDAIVDITPVRESDEVFGGVDHISILLGKTDADSFKSPEQAQFWANDAYSLVPGSYNIVNRDGHYYIQMRKNVDETALSVTDLRLGTGNATQETWLNVFIGFLRNPDTLLSDPTVANRKVATYGGNAVAKRLEEVLKPITKLSKNQVEKLKTVMDHARFEFRNVQTPDGKIERVRGKFYDNVGEFERSYFKIHGDMPSYDESLAYFSFRDVMDWDFLQRNLSVRRDKDRLGIEQKAFTFTILDKKAQTSTVSSSLFFEGRTLENLPHTGTTPFTVGWVRPEDGSLRFNLSTKMRKNEWDELDEAIASGNYEVIQVADPKSRPLNELLQSGGEPVEYLVVRDIKTKPLSSDQVAYNEGGHWNYPQNGWYSKQPSVHNTKFGRKVYDGDTVLHYYPAGAQGRKFNQAYEAGRQLIKDVAARKVSIAAADRWISTHLPYDNLNAFMKIFRSKENPNAAFDINSPFILTPSGVSAADALDLKSVFGRDVVNVSRSDHNLTGYINSKYTQQRGERVTSILEAGTESNPLFALTGAPLLDSMETLRLSATQIAKDRFYEDLKHQSIEDWIAQFGRIIDASPEQLRADPIKYLKGVENKLTIREGSDKAVISAAYQSRRALLQILGEPTEDALLARWAKQKIIDELYRTRGLKSVKSIEPLLWDSNLDPAAMARYVTFEAHLGLFNPTQVFLQGMAASFAMAIDGNPVRAARATHAFWSMRMRGMAVDGSKAQGWFSKQVSKALAIDNDVMDEMYTLWKESGAAFIEGEFANLDNYLNPGMFMDNRTGKRALRAGEFFFHEGNGIHRGTSFTLAYLAWRDANPTAKLTNAAKRQIIDRMDKLYINMSRASNASWQRGWPSIPTQFFSFQARMSELLLAGTFGGKAILTPAEKLRLIVVNSALFGIPVGTLGTTLGVAFPAYDSIKTKLLEEGVNFQEPMWDLFMNGFMGAATQWVFGDSYDVSSRIGPGGLSWAEDLWNLDFMRALGASPNFLNDVMSLGSPFLASAASLFNENPDARYEPSEQDFLEAIREVSSASHFLRAMYIFNTGKWKDRRDGLVGVVNDHDIRTTIAVALGLTPSDIADTYLKADSNKKTQEAQNAIRREVIKNYRYGVDAYSDRKWDQGDRYFRNAVALMIGGGFDEQKRGEVFREAIKYTAPLSRQVEMEFIRNDPKKRFQTYLDKVSEGGN